MRNNKPTHPRKIPSERRQNPRDHGTGSLYIRQGKHPMRRYRIGNLSARGVFVETRGFTLPLDAAVDLVYVVSTGKIVKTYHRKAIVAHRSNDGIGMLL